MNAKLKQVKELAKVELYIKDILWNFRVLNTKDYLYLHGDDSRGITEEEHLTIDLKLSSFCQSLIRHELFHAYVASCCINSIPDMSASGMEELAAEIVEFHAEDIVKNTKMIYNNLNAKLKKLPKARK